MDRGGHRNHPNGRTSIAVFPAASYLKHCTLLDALRDIFFVTFRPCLREEIGDYRFALLWGAADDVVADAQRLGVRCLALARGEREAATSCPGKVAFADVPGIDEAIRGQCFVESESLKITSITTRPGEVFATRSGLPIWIRHDRGSASVDFIAVEPRLLNSGELLREHLCPGSVSHILPLFHFVREAAGEGNWDSGPRQACFIIDDPSLYRPSYGCLHFDQLATHATEHGYHVSIATIPLDTWWVHQTVRSLLRDNAKQMSLVIHGNNHTYLEMWRNGSNGHYLSELAQALRRVSRFEKQHGLRFSRVFEAPHGVIACEVFGPLVSLGYEGTLYTPSQFINRNRNNGWPASFGSSPVDVSPQGLCVIPRLIMSRDWRADVSIAAFLRQPIVLVGHHQDCLTGLELLSEFAARVNGLGNVRWSSLSEMARSRFTSRREGSSWVVRLGGRAVDCHVPSGVTQIVIERPWILGEAEPMKMYGITETAEPLEQMAGAVSEPLPWQLEAGGKLRIESPPKILVNPDSVTHPPKRMWPVIRKVLVEARDRSHPFLPEVVRRLGSTRSMLGMSHQRLAARTK